VVVSTMANVQACCIAATMPSHTKFTTFNGLQPMRVFDCFAGDASELAAAKRATAAEFSRGLEAWQTADFKKAVASFENVLRLNPADGTAQRYLARAGEHATRGTAADWTGIEVMERK